MHVKFVSLLFSQKVAHFLALAIASFFANKLFAGHQLKRNKCNICGFEKWPAIRASMGGVLGWVAWMLCLHGWSKWCPCVSCVIAWVAC